MLWAFFFADDELRLAVRTAAGDADILLFAVRTAAGATDALQLTPLFAQQALIVKLCCIHC